jgi:hypothetical protein
LNTEQPTIQGFKIDPNGNKLIKNTFSLVYGKREIYTCIVLDCNNYVFFSEKDAEFYKAKGWVRPDGSPIKPKMCQKHRDEKRGRVHAVKKPIYYK